MISLLNESVGASFSDLSCRFDSQATEATPSGVSGGLTMDPVTWLMISALQVPKTAEIPSPDMHSLSGILDQCWIVMLSLGFQSLKDPTDLNFGSGWRIPS